MEIPNNETLFAMPLGVTEWLAELQSGFCGYDTAFFVTDLHQVFHGNESPMATTELDLWVMLQSGFERRSAFSGHDCAWFASDMQTRVATEPDAGRGGLQSHY